MLTNAAILAQAMAAVDVATIEVTYSGSGDEGNIDQTDVLAADEKEIEDIGHLERLSLARVTLLNDDGTPGEPMQLESAAEVLFEDALAEAGHDGYHNDEGGFGRFVIAADGTLTLDHNDYVTESVNSTYEYTAEPLPPAPLPQDQVTLAA